MRIPMIAGNWKMNTTVTEAVTLVKEMLPGLEKTGNVEKLVCPPFVSLASVRELITNTSVKLGAQNVYFEDKGAFTGEVSPLMLAGLCEYVIIGHSERRQYFNETNDTVNRKIKATLKASLKPIVCVGEKLEENEAGQTEEVVTSQVKAALTGIDLTPSLMIAYEPIWAIGTGKSATSAQANNTIGLIRSTISGIYGSQAADNIRILYGGSVNAANATELMSQPEIDGGLVGGASLKATDFVSIVQQASAVRK